MLLLSLAAGACVIASCNAFADDEDEPGSDERPKKDDILVFSEGDQAGKIIKPDDLKLGGPPVHAWPMDPKTKVVRKGSRLNEILVVKLILPSWMIQQSRVPPMASLHIRLSAHMPGVP